MQVDDLRIVTPMEDLISYLRIVFKGPFEKNRFSNGSAPLITIPALSAEAVSYFPLNGYHVRDDVYAKQTFECCV